MEKFWELLQEGVIVQGLIALALVVTVCVMVATGQAVPDTLSGALMVVLGFYFGSQTQKFAASRLAK